MTVLACSNQTQNARLGVILAKRNIGRAVDRNRIRRQIRECFRLSKHQLIGLDIIVIGKSGLKDFRDSHEFCRQLKQRWEDIVKQWKRYSAT